MGEKPGGAVGRREDRGDVPRSPRRHGVAQGAAGSARHPLLHRVRPHQQGDRPHVIITRTKCMYWRVSDFLFSFITISRLFSIINVPRALANLASSARPKQKRENQKKKNPLQQQRSVLVPMVTRPKGMAGGARVRPPSVPAIRRPQRVSSRCSRCLATARGGEGESWEDYLTKEERPDGSKHFRFVGGLKSGRQAKSRRRVRSLTYLPT